MSTLFGLCVLIAAVLAAPSLDVKKIVVDKYIGVAEYQNHSAVVVNFTLSYFDERQQRRPVTGLQPSDFTLSYDDGAEAMDASEIAVALRQLEGAQASSTRMEGKTEASADGHWTNTVFLMVDMSPSTGESGGAARRRAVVLDALTAAEKAAVPGVRVGLYAFADVGSLETVIAPTTDLGAVRRSATALLGLTTAESVKRFGRATALAQSLFAMLAIVEKTVAHSTAAAPVGHVWIVTDGQDTVRTQTAAAASHQLAAVYERWNTQHAAISVRPIVTSLAPASFINGLHLRQPTIDGTRSTAAAFLQLFEGIAQDTPSVFQLAVCDSARDGAPQQRRTLSLRGHPILQYSFSPRHFQREGAAQCDPRVVLSLPPPAAGPADLGPIGGSPPSPDFQGWSGSL